MTSVGYLLDTNVVVELIRGKKLGQHIDHTYGLSGGFSRCLISVVTVGELYSLARKFKWGASKTDLLRELIDELVTVDISDEAILSGYGEIDFAMDVTGQPMGKNDLWIAATARAISGTLLTTDKDFDRLHPVWIDRIWIDPAHGKGP